MNPFDELSIEESVRIREKKSAPGGVEDICVISAGPPKAQDVLRTAMAMGADRAIHVDVKEGEDLEPLTVAKLLKKTVENERSNFVLLGKQSIDDDAGQTGQMLAGLLGWSQATQASKVEFGEGDSVSVTREVDGGVETLKGKLPMVVTTDLRLNEPRYASLPNIMKAKKKKLEKKTLADFGVENQRRLKVLKVTGRFMISCPGGSSRNADIIVQNPHRDRAVERLRTWVDLWPSSRSLVLFKWSQQFDPVIKSSHNSAAQSISIEGTQNNPSKQKFTSVQAKANALKSYYTQTLGKERPQVAMVSPRLLLPRPQRLIVSLCGTSVSLPTFPKASFCSLYYRLSLQPARKPPRSLLASWMQITGDYLTECQLTIGLIQRQSTHRISIYTGRRCPQEFHNKLFF